MTGNLISRERLGHTHREDSHIKMESGALVAQWLKNLPASAGDMGSSPGPGRSHMPRSN